MKRIVDYIILAVFVVLLAAAADRFNLGPGVARAIYDGFRYVAALGCTVDSLAGSYTMPLFKC